MSEFNPSPNEAFVQPQTLTTVLEMPQISERTELCESRSRTSSRSLIYTASQINVSELDTDVGPTTRRWAVLGAFCSLSCFNSMMWISYAPIRAATATYYGVSGDTVDWLSMIYMATYPLVFAPMSWYIEDGGVALKRGLRVSAMLNLVAALVRWGSTCNQSFVVLISGQIIGSLAQGFTLGAPPRLSGLWFPEYEWGLCTGIGVLSNQVGPVLAYWIAPIMVNSTTGYGMKSFALLEISLVVASNFFIFIAIKDNPSKPPSLIAAHRSKFENHRSLWDYCTSLWVMVSKPNLLMLSLGYGFLVGVLYAFETLVEELLPSLNSNQQSAIGIVALVSGLPGTVAGGWILDMLGAYKWINILICFGAAAALAFMTSFTERVHESFFLLMGLVSVMGFLLCAGISAGFEWGAELSFPIPESTLAGVLNVFAQMGGVALIYGMEAVVSARGATIGNAVLAASLVLAGVLYVLISNKLKRNLSKSKLNELKAEYSEDVEGTPLK